jgi:hypothetical protein
MKKVKNIVIAFLVIIFMGCSDYLDINTDPINPSEVEIDKMLPGIQREASDVFALRFSSIANVCAVYIHQLTTRESFDAYQVRGGDYSMRTSWQAIFIETLADIEVLLVEAEEADNKAYSGIAKIFKAYIYSQLVDSWGEIPFTEAITDIVAPNFEANSDDDQEIYTALFVLLDEGIADLNNEEAENLILPGSDDLIYNGDLEKWEKAANTIKLKLYNQVRNTSLWDQAAVVALLNSDMLIEADEHLWLYYNISSTPENRHPGFIDDWAGSQISLYISPWFFEMLKGANPNIFTGITDPRIPYYFYTQLGGGDTENPPEYKWGDFVSIYFGSIGTNRDHGGRKTFTMVGMYPVGGRYDEGETLQGTSDVATGSAPHRFLSYADRLFIEAELALEGIQGDARDLLEQAMYASFIQVDEVVDVAAPTDQTDIPLLSGSGSDTAYVDAILILYDAASDEGKLEIVMTQKWISMFGGNTVDQYTDYRRTGYPVLFDPNVDPTLGGPDGSGPVPTRVDRDYPRSMPWATTELDVNPNAPEQKNVTTYRVFWDQ